MDLRVLQNQNTSLNYSDSRKIKSKNNDFANKLNEELNNKSSIYISKSTNNSMNEDEKQSLIEDKAIYDEEHLKDKGIEFGSKEWEYWKETEGSECIPRLYEPWQVRRSWREMINGAKTPSERQDIVSMKLLLFSEECQDENSAVNGNNNLSDYFGFIKGKKNFYEEVSKIDLGHSYKSYIDLLDKLEDKISKYLI